MIQLQTTPTSPSSRGPIKPGITSYTRAGNLRIFAWLAAFFIAFLMAPGPGPFAADAQPPRTESQIEATIIHVDKYGVYAPNMVFYWDPGMNKQKVAALTGVAEQLRNKNAVITYTTTSDITRDKRPVLVDIAALKGEVSPAGDSAPPREPSRPSPAESEKNTPPAISTTANGGYRNRKTKKPRHKNPGKKPELGQAPAGFSWSSTITRTEVINFVYNCIDAAQYQDIERSLGCYAEQVDYYSKGTVNQDFIRKDKGYYFRNWDRISSTIDGDIVLIVIDQPDLKIAKFNSRFYVENAKNRASDGLKIFGKSKK